MKTTEILDRLDDESRESLLEALLDAANVRYVGNMTTHRAEIGARVLAAIDDAMGAAMDAERDAAEYAKEMERDNMIEQATQVAGWR